MRTHAATVNDMLEDLEINVQAADYVHPSRATKVDDDLEVVWKPAQKKSSWYRMVRRRKSGPPQIR
ncbi:ubiquitin-like domain-containing protein [Peribacillus frigoritolerans]|nr:ubiquitin-like domain-containing protein [Peribacillus frigoritolerans]